VTSASVVVPTHNRAALLGDCLRTLVGQDCAPERYEIIVIDDGSSDGTAEVVRAVAETAPMPVRYVRQNAAGANAARNRGLAMATGDPICFVDDDQEMDAAWLGRLVAGTEQFPDAGCVGGPIRLRAGRPTPWVCPEHDLGVGELDHGPTACIVEHVWGGNMAIRRAAVERVGPFHEFRRLGHNETEWQGRLQRAGIPIAYVPDAVVWHRRRAADLRLDRLAWSQFFRGIGQARNWGGGGRPYGLGRELRWGREALAHWRATACAGGLLEASRHAGRAVGSLAGRPSAGSEEAAAVPD
jgi:GT2 family glycosyltransferase